MDIHFRMTVSAGKRTKTSVTAYSTAVNPRALKFSNGKTITEKEIASHIERVLTEAIEKIKNEARLASLVGA